MFNSILLTTTIFLLSAAGLSAQGNKNNGPRFLDDISVEVAPLKTSSGTTETKAQHAVYTVNKEPVSEQTSSAAIEMADQLQFKYSLLLDTEVETVSNLELFKLIDDWFGTRYRMGGTTKSGIDCSALMQVLFTSVYSLSLPRTAREQYGQCTKIDKSELKEGDLVFFNTTGGVSHVGMYLSNNKFVHAGSSTGVTIADLNEEYWSKRFISAGRITDSLVSSSKP